MEQRIFRYIFAALLAGVIACAAVIIRMLKTAPQAEAFTNAVLVWEGIKHAAA